MVVALALAAGPAIGTASLSPGSVAAWTSYTAANEQRILRELSARGPRFLALDFAKAAAAERTAVLSGAIDIEPMGAVNVRGEGIEVPAAMVHHWRGAVLIPGAKLEDLLAKLKSGVPDTRQEDVLQSKVISRTPDGMHVYLKLQRTKFVTAVYNTEHLVTFARFDATHASSASTAIKIAELENPNTPAERELPPGQDRGFLWRWNTYWRYEQVPAGVIAECESVSLSRDIPTVIKYLASPLIASTSRESMERTLSGLRERHRTNR
jgi:hypothetical protein